MMAKKIRSEITHEREIALTHPLLHKEISEKIDKNLDVSNRRLKAVVPLKERKLNRVDKLLEEIKEIQKTCKHDFRLLKPVELKESKVKGIFILYDASLTPHERIEASILKLRCLQCSEEKEVFIKDTCPYCLGKMVERELLRYREKYFGIPYLYYTPRLYVCSKCGFKGLVDEWDQ